MIRTLAPLDRVVCFLGASAFLLGAATHSVAQQTMPSGWVWPTGSSNSCSYLGWLGVPTSGPYAGQFHLAQDMCRDLGQPIYAIGDGEVIVSNTAVTGYGPGGGSGGAVVVRHQAADGTWFTALYGHLDSPRALGPVGAGDSLGVANAYSLPHLHFAISPGFELNSNPFKGYTSVISNTYGYVDPLPFLALHPRASLARLATDQTVYWVQSGRKYGVYPASVLTAMAGVPGWSSVSVVSELPSVTGPIFIEPKPGSDGLLLRQVGTQTVYLLQNGRLRAFTSEDALNWMGTDWRPYVIDVSASLLAAFPRATMNVHALAEGDPSVKAAFVQAYSENVTSCGTTRDWKGWPGTHARCIEFPQSEVLISAVHPQTGTTGKYQNFGNDSTRYGGLVWSSLGRAYAVYGAIYTKWGQMGYSGSCLGFPTSNEYTVPGTSRRRTDFQGGSITWDGTTAAAVCGTTTDLSPPSLSVTSHTPGQTVTTSVVTVAGTASDDGRGNSGISSVTLNAIRASNDTAVGSGTASWSRTVTLTPGQNSILIVARDNSPAQNAAPQTLTLTYQPDDVTAPHLAITSHVANQTVSTPSITLSGTATDAGYGSSGIFSVTVNGVRAANDTASANGTAHWSRALTLASGANTITVVARDNSSSQNATTRSITIHYLPADITAPLLSILSHASNQVLNTPTLTLAGTASDSGRGGNGVASVTVNGIRAANDTATGNGTAYWSRTLTLTQGSNAITVVARDDSAAQNAVQQTLYLTYQPADTTPPWLSVWSHIPNQVVSSSSITLAGSATDAGYGNSGIWSVTVNGVRAAGDTATASGTAYWSRTLALVEGPNVITVVARDASPAQNSTSTVLTIHRQGTCAVTLTSTGAAAPVPGTTGAIDVVASAGCPWSASTTTPWLTLTGATSGSGSSTVAYSVAANTTTQARTGTVNIAGQTFTVTQAAFPSGLTRRRYFAEGATGVVRQGFFDTRVALLNPDAYSAATVMLEFNRLGGGTYWYGPLHLPSVSRTTVDVQHAVPGLARESFSTAVHSDFPVIADRTMTWDSGGYGSHAETSVAAPALEWYFAEGATHSGFRLYFLLQNPNPVPATVQVTYLLPAPRLPIVVTCSVAAHTRQNIFANDQLCPTGNLPTVPAAIVNSDVSTVFRVLNGVPIIVERAMYKGDTFNAGTAAAGINGPQLNWFLAEGSTLQLFDTYVLLANPSNRDADVELDFYRQGRHSTPLTLSAEFDSAFCVVQPGPCPSQRIRVPAGSRRTIWLNGIAGLELLTGVSTAVRVLNGVGILVERAMWWPDSPTRWVEGHASFGAVQSGLMWAMADGEVGGVRNVATYVLVANVSDRPAYVTATLAFDDGTPPVHVSLPMVVARSRATLAITRDEIPPGASTVLTPAVIAAGKRFSVIVEASEQVVVERAMYSSDGQTASFYPYWSAGTNVLATRVR